MSSEKIKTTILIIDENQVPVSIPTAKVYYRYYNMLYFDRLITVFLLIGIIGFISAYVYYAYQSNLLLNKASETCPAFFCPGNQNQKAPCGGKGFHRDEATGKIVCTT